MTVSATEAQDTRWETMTTKDIQIPHGRIRYREAGSGRPIVFLHGVLVDGRLWRKVAPALSAGHRVIVPDWPLGAHELPLADGADVSLPGLAQMVGDFVAALELDDVVLVANDTGGAVAQQTVVDHPERIGALVLTPCDSHGHFFPPVLRYLMVMSRLPGFGFTVAQTLRIRFLRGLPIAFGWTSKRAMPDDVTEALLAPMRRHRHVRRDFRRLVGNVSPRYTQALLPRLREFDKPVLIAWAREDRLFPYAHAEDLAQRFPSARLEPVEDSYTFVPEDQPERLTELIRGFAG
jgi:pimeloyl-ACP methyl ester carboxylesterase